ncbi:MAG: bifunctional nuclease family protein [Coriobacteriaceae bacterium]|nr:bifunctional nuclease family protein [Coriobacteriaceae bacterium]
MIRVDIESIVMASGPVPSVVVLRERTTGSAAGAPSRALSIQTGAYEAAAIGNGAEFTKQTKRPIAHDVLLETVRELGAKVERVEINRWDAPVFYADIVLGNRRAARDDTPAEGEDREGGTAHAGEIKIDARPSDAIAVALRANAPIYVEDDVMNRAGSVSIAPVTEQDREQAAEEELKRFDEFIEQLSPDDF